MVEFDLARSYSIARQLVPALDYPVAPWAD